MRRIALGLDYPVPATIDDLAILPEIERRCGQPGTLVAPVNCRLRQQLSASETSKPSRRQCYDPGDGARSAHRSGAGADRRSGCAERPPG
jgi:hypothetical protein